MRFNVLTAVSTKVTACWDIALCSLEVETVSEVLTAPITGAIHVQEYKQA
jgi:hypothetical protein